MHPPDHHEDHPHVVSRNARNGLILFAIYVLLYARFIYLTVFRFESLAEDAVAGVNLAIIYGFCLIAAAVGLALVYMLLCRGSQSRADRESQP